VHTRVAHPRRHRRSLRGQWHVDKEIIEAYPDLEAEDVAEALRYAADLTEERVMPIDFTES